jgi:hypothetical protein
MHNSKKHNTKTMTNEKNNGNVDSVWTLASQVINRLGYPVLLVVVLAYGVYMFTEQKNRSEEILNQQRNASQNLLNEANQIARQSYLSVADMHQKVIANINTALDTLEKVQIRSDKEADEASKAIEDRNTALDDLEKVKNDAEEIKRKALEEVNKAKKEVDKSKDDLIKLETEKKDKLKYLSMRESDYKELVKSLIGAIEDDTENTETIEDLAAKIKAGYLVNADELFSAYMSYPSNQNLKRLGDLIGFRINDIVDVILKRNGYDYDQWIKSQEGSGQTIIGGKSDLDYGLRNLILMDFESGNLYDIEHLTNLHVLSLPSTDNWDTSNYYYGYIDKDNEYYGEEIKNPSQTIKNGYWTLSSLISDDLPDAEFSSITGQEKKYRPLSLLEIEDIYSEKLFDAILDDAPQFDNLYQMIKRAKKSQIDALIPISVGRGFGNLRQAIIGGLHAAISKDDEARQALSPPSFSQSWGELAAVALQPTFKFENIEVSEDRRNASVTFSYSMPYREAWMAILTLSARNEGNEWSLSGFNTTPDDTMLIEQLAR